MLKKIINQHKKTSNFLLLFLVLIIFGGIFNKIISIDFLSDTKESEKYSILDKIIYQIRCNNERHIRLRELKPNQKTFRIPPNNFKTLENKKYVFETDENGFLKPSMIHKKPDLQIFFLGGSTTECEYVDEKSRFPYLVGRILEEKTKIKINSDNAAKSGNNSLHSINILLNKLIPFNPNIVIMMHNINDLSTLFYEGTYWNNNKAITPIVCNQKNNKEFINNDQWSLSKGLNNNLELENVINDFKENLKIFISISRAKNISPILMTQANRIENNSNFNINRGEEFSKVYRQNYIKFNQIIRDIAKEEKVWLIDLAKLIPSEEKYIYDDVHLNKEGSELVAIEIEKNLEQFLKANKTKFNINF